MTRIPEEWYLNITKKLTESNNKILTLTDFVFSLIILERQETVQQIVRLEHHPC